MKEALDTLESEPEGEAHRTSGDAGLIPGLVVLWSRSDPALLGAWLPVPQVASDTPSVFGRGEPLATDEYPRLSWFRQRPLVNERVVPVTARSISRTQLLVRATGPATLQLVNVGRARLSINGRAAERGEAHAGDIVELGRELCLLCTSRERKLRGVVAAPHHAFGEPDAHGLVGESPAAWALRTQIARAAQSRAHVLILGDSGTGKEIVARAIHALTPEVGALVSRNAATLPETLVDAELFGNARSYPNPGMPERPGLIGAAHRGTLFLDEFGELSLAAQAHLLRVLDSGEYQRLGEATVRRASFRLIAATNRPEQALREDVLARFGVIIRVPDVASRREDLPLLVRHLVRTQASGDPENHPSFTTAWIRELVERPPAGNVRGLANWLCAAPWEDPVLSATSPPSEPVSNPRRDERGATDEERRRSELQAALDANNGSIEKTWRALGLSSRYVMMRLIQKYSLVVRKHPAPR